MSEKITKQAVLKYDLYEERHAFLQAVHGENLCSFVRDLVEAIVSNAKGHQRFVWENEDYDPDNHESTLKFVNLELDAHTADGLLREIKNQLIENEVDMSLFEHLNFKYEEE